MSLYQDIFAAAEPTHDPKVIEELVRGFQPTGTLDHLTRRQLTDDAHVAAEMLALDPTLTAAVQAQHAP